MMGISIEQSALSIGIIECGISAEHTQSLSISLFFLRLVWLFSVQLVRACSSSSSTEPQGKKKKEEEEECGFGHKVKSAY
jgi:hypothetical protein